MGVKPNVVVKKPKSEGGTEVGRFRVVSESEGVQDFLARVAQHMGYIPEYFPWKVLLHNGLELDDRLPLDEEELEFVLERLKPYRGPSKQVFSYLAIGKSTSLRRTDKVAAVVAKAQNASLKCAGDRSKYEAWAAQQRAEQRVLMQQMAVRQQQQQLEFVAHVPVPQPTNSGVVAVEAAPVESVAVAKPKGLDPDFVRKQLMVFVKDVMATDDELELDSPFMEAGMDSLSSVSLMSMVAKEFQMALSPSLVFDFPTVRALEDHLVEESKNM